MEPEADLGAVNHPSVVLHVDAAFLPAAGWVIRKRRIPFNVLYCLQIFGGEFLEAVVTTVRFRHCTRLVLFGGSESLTFLGVTVHNMLMMLLDFSCPS